MTFIDDRPPYRALDGAYAPSRYSGKITGNTMSVV